MKPQVNAWNAVAKERHGQKKAPQNEIVALLQEIIREANRVIHAAGFDIIEIKEDKKGEHYCILAQK